MRFPTHVGVDRRRCNCQLVVPTHVGEPWRGEAESLTSFSKILFASDTLISLQNATLQSTSDKRE